MDRIGPTRHPGGAASGWQCWRELVFLHWPYPPAAVRSVVPKALELDLHDGVAYVGIVAFAMHGVRPRALPEPLAFTFLETNVRTYVHLAGRAPGVYFFSLDAASRLAVAAARIGWGLPYFYSRMRSQRTGETFGYEFERLSGTRPRFRARWEIGEALGPAAPDTLEHFLVERYLLHLERGGRLYTGQVHHPPYPLRAARLLELEEQIIASAGIPAPIGPPPLVHYADGVDVEIFDLAPILA
jgi:uncharacterized protein